MKTNLFEIAGTPEWTADNHRRMMKIRGSDENVENWIEFYVNNLMLIFNEKDSDGKLIQTVLGIINKNIDFIIRVYELRRPLERYKKYRMDVENFEIYTRRYFHDFATNLFERDNFEQKMNQNIGVKKIATQLQNNLEKMSIFAGHAKGEVEFPTENEETVNMKKKEFQITIETIGENIEAFAEVKDLLKELYPELKTVEFDEGKLWVKIFENIKSGMVDIKKKKKMIEMFESGHKG